MLQRDERRAGDNPSSGLMVMGGGRLCVCVCVRACKISLNFNLIIPIRTTALTIARVVIQELTAEIKFMAPVWRWGLVKQPVATMRQVVSNEWVTHSKCPGDETTYHRR